MNMLHIDRQATAWARWATEQGARFDAAGKAKESADFSLEVGARGFALPSKLIGVSETQHLVQELVGKGRARLRWGRTHEGRIVATWRSLRLGFIQRKHTCWLAPLLDQSFALAPRMHVLAVTGGTKSKPTRGVNIVISRLFEAIAYRKLAPEQAAEEVLQHA